MKMNVYSIRDIHVGFMSPSLDQNDETAARNFAFAVSNNPGVLGFRPGDFDLYCIGVFESDNASITPINPIRMIVNGAAVIGEKKDA